MKLESGHVYIVTARTRWLSAQQTGELRTPSLAAEGFIHAATGAQVAGVLARHFAGQPDLVLLELDAPALADALRYEASARNCELFPHIHAPVPVSAVRAVEPIVA